MIIYKNIPIVDSWVGFIDKEYWDLFVTITFKTITPCFSKYEGSFNAIEKFKYFFKHLNSYPNEFFSKFIFTFTVFERNSYRNGVHIHSFIRGISPSKAELLQSKLASSLGLSTVTTYNTSGGAKYYLCKKMIGNTLEHYDKYTINSAVRA